MEKEELNLLNQQFAELTGVKKVRSFIVNQDTHEIRLYSHISNCYKIPKGWKHSYSFYFDHDIYPDFTSPNNFSKLINIQWEVFGSLGPQYVRVGVESFEQNYLSMKIKAIQVCQSLGGGDLLDYYMHKVRQTKFDYNLEEDK